MSSFIFQCSLYNQTEVEGSLCYKLCNTKDLQYESCTNYKAGKKVLFMKCEGCDSSTNRKIRVVFKMKETLENREMFSTNMAPEDDSDESVKKYIEIISKLVNNSYWYKFAKDMSKEKDILSLTWGWNINEYLAETTLPKRKAIAVAASSIWSLSEQSEYLFSRLLHDKVFVPKIYGSCGPAYFVEFTQTIRKYEYELFSSSFSYPWPERALLAVRLIDLIKQIDSGLHEPLHICDVKPDNFGRRDNWEVTLLDTDCALFETDLMSQFNHSVCKTHADCDFFDCKGYCDKTRGHCLQRRMNNNLQVQKISVHIGSWPSKLHLRLKEYKIANVNYLFNTYRQNSAIQYCRDKDSEDYCSPIVCLYTLATIKNAEIIFNGWKCGLERP